MPMFDAIIVGAGPAGLSAALILGRCRRKVLVCDTGEPRNAVSRGLHGFLTRDGIEPSEFLRIGREQLRPYPSVEFRDVEVTDAESVNDRFEIALGDGSRFSSRKLLLATGVVDNIPEIEGIEPLYGRSVFHCPYCDGWEMRDQALAVYGKGEGGYGLALKLITWSDDLVLCTDGPAELGGEALEQLSRHGIRLREEGIVRLEGGGGITASGSAANCRRGLAASSRTRAALKPVSMKQRRSLVSTSPETPRTPSNWPLSRLRKGPKPPLP